MHGAVTLFSSSAPNHKLLRGVGFPVPGNIYSGTYIEVASAFMAMSVIKLETGLS